MANIRFTGSLCHRVASYAALMRISTRVWGAQLLGVKPPCRRSTLHEIGIQFWRQQFRRALKMDDIAAGRAYFDSLQTLTGEHYDVVQRPAAEHGPKGHWVEPNALRRDVALLYMHGGGYTFDAFMSDEFANLLSHTTGALLFRMNYRLTPEHSHPAQSEDGLTAYRALLDEVGPERLILIGDSAGGHLVLMTLLAAQREGLAQPALAIALSPWTDIGARGASLLDNDAYDIVEGWNALLYGEYLTGGKAAEMRDELSPISHDYKGLAPIYMQGGEKEVLIDMIADFAIVQARNNAGICLDIWPNMTHDFFGYGQTLPESAQALDRICAAIDAFTGPDKTEFKSSVWTKVNTFSNGASATNPTYE